MKDVVIVDGGLAGLSAGWRLRHWDAVLLEADQRVGGRIRSERRGQYWLNWGGHVFARLLKVLSGEVRPLELLLPQLGQRMQTAAEQRSHLLSSNRVAGGQAIDPVQAGTDPHPRRLTAFGVVGRRSG
jgi:uncharacterized protein with NAD-binding domain and iron-sulfur cluster